MHPLNNVSTVVEHPADIFCVHCTCKVGVAVMPAVSTRRTYPLWKKWREKKGSGAVPWEVSIHLWSTKKPEKLYVQIIKINKKKESLWSGPMWITNLKWRLKKIQDANCRVSVLVLCKSHWCCRHLQKLLPFAHHCAADVCCCQQHCGLPCSCPRNYCLFLFLVPSCGKFLCSGF